MYIPRLIYSIKKKPDLVKKLPHAFVYECICHLTQACVIEFKQ